MTRWTSFKVSAGYGRLYVSGPHAQVARGIPGSAWNPGRSSFEVSLTLETLRALRQASGLTKQEFAARCAPEVLSWAQAAGASESRVALLHESINRGELLELPWEVTDGSSKPPFEHQRVMATVAGALEGSAFLCEMGTGKTRAAIEASAYRMERDLDVVLAVCPKGVMGTWEREVKAWTQRRSVLLDGPVKQRAKRLREEEFDGAFLLLNYDALDALKEDLVALCGRKRVGIILDESQRVKNPQAKVTKAAMELARVSSWRLAMTGTPITNGAHDVWSQWYVVDLGVTFGANFRQFRNEFFNDNPYTFALEPKEGTLQKIGARMRKRGVRYRKVDCLDLPPKVFELAECEMSKEQSKAYREMSEWLYTQFEEDGDVATAATSLVKLLRLTQITSGFLPTEGEATHFFKPNPKMTLLEELVRENIAGQQIIVWAWYRNDVAAIVKMFDDLKPVRLVGGMTTEERSEAERRFQSGESRLLVANPASGGVGITLTAASMAIYYSQDYSLEGRMQSEDRCHRAGSERHNKVTYVDLVCKGTVDEIVREALVAKKNVADVVVDLRQHLREG